MDLREVINGILYVLRAGCSWRMVPHDLPPWQTLYKYFRQWTRDGTWERVHETLRPMVREAMTLSLSPGQVHDAPEGRALLRRLAAEQEGLPLLMDRAYEGDETRQLALDLGFTLVMPPKRNRVDHWSMTGSCTGGATRWRGCSGG